MGGRRGTVAERMARWVEHEPNTGCHLWSGCGLQSGYGAINVGGAMYLAHRVSFEMTHGPIPAGMFVCHRCDTPACVNPDHLFLGTAQDNTDDMIAKGRKIDVGLVGEANGRAKLSEQDVARIMALLPAQTQQSIADKFGVSRSLIGEIKNGRAWPHLKDAAR